MTPTDTFRLFLSRYPLDRSKLAKSMNMSQQKLQSIIDGKSIIDLSDFGTFCKVTGVSSENILRGF